MSTWYTGIEMEVKKGALEGPRSCRSCGCGEWEAMVDLCFVAWADELLCQWCIQKLGVVAVGLSLRQPARG
jgi:hypothetical protein